MLVLEWLYEIMTFMMPEFTDIVPQRAFAWATSIHVTASVYVAWDKKWCNSATAK